MTNSSENKTNKLGERLNYQKYIWEINKQQNLINEII